jgi:DEAD/DEAH box helicase domain-containing protein
MARFPLVLDLETKHTFRDFSDHKKLGISVCAVYDYATGLGTVFEEKELPQMYKLLENCSYIVGYNIRSFDLPVLQAYYPGDITQFKTCDLMDDVREKIGRRLALNDLAYATLNKKKSGHGLMAIDYYREGKMKELKSYCMDDVLITKDLFEFGIKNKEIYYINEVGKLAVQVDWEKYMKDDTSASDMSLTLPF